MRAKLSWGLLLGVLAAGPAFAAQIAPVTVETGIVQGVEKERGIVQYLGIPYAVPPVGALRWREPTPAKPWSGTLNADHFGNDCMQNHFHVPWPQIDPPNSEDCLTVNVWAPAAVAKAPVMVFIYGGGFNIGSGATVLYDGGSFAKRGIVLVNFNYRVGKFGFFAHPALTKENPEGLLGNYGLMDQILALKWVQKNIAAFGGDPGNVTIFGESAGAISVDYLMTSPLAKGLFNKAVVESGFGRAPTQSMAEAEAKGKTATDLWGVAADDLTAMRAVPAEKVLGDTTMMKGGAFPMIDGHIVAEETMAAFEAGHVAHVPYIIGSNSYEIGLFAVWAKDLSIKMAPVWPKVETLYDGFGRNDKGVTEIQVMTDIMLTAPARELARAAAKAGLPTYVYFYSYVPPSQREKIPGALHFMEIPAVFDAMAWIEPKPDAETAQVSEAMQSRWAAFAKTGVPGEWPRFTTDNETWLEFSGAGAIPRKDLLKARLDFVDALPPPPRGN